MGFSIGLHRVQSASIARGLPISFSCRRLAICLPGNIPLSLGDASQAGHYSREALGRAYEVSAFLTHPASHGALRGAGNIPLKASGGLPSLREPGCPACVYATNLTHNEGGCLVWEAQTPASLPDTPLHWVQCQALDVTQTAKCCFKCVLSVGCRGGGGGGGGRPSTGVSPTSRGLPAGRANQTLVLSQNPPTHLHWKLIAVLQAREYGQNRSIPYNAVADMLSQYLGKVRPWDCTVATRLSPLLRIPHT